MTHTQLTDTLNHYNWLRKDRKRVVIAAKFAKRIWLSPVNMPDFGLLNPVGRWNWFN